MHYYKDLVLSGTAYTLNALDEAQLNVVKKIQVSGAISEVKNLQMIELQKAILAIGMFSLFESMLQQELNCTNGFRKAKELLKKAENHKLLERFNTFYLAINVLKHGRGSSYDKLISTTEQLPFQIKSKNQSFFNEGEVDEVATYIKVDNAFVLNCADIIQQVSNAVWTHNNFEKE